MSKRRIQSKIKTLENEIEGFFGLSEDGRWKVLATLRHEIPSFSLELESQLLYIRLTFELITKVGYFKCVFDANNYHYQRECEIILSERMNEVYKKEGYSEILGNFVRKYHHLATNERDRRIKAKIENTYRESSKLQISLSEILVNGANVSFWFMVEPGKNTPEELFRLSFGDFNSRIDRVCFENKSPSIIVISDGRQRSQLQRHRISKFKEVNFKNIRSTKIEMPFSELFEGDKLYYYDYRCGWIDATVEQCHENLDHLGNKQRGYVLRISMRVRPPFKWSDECQNFFETIACSSQIEEQKDFEIPSFVTVDSRSPALSLSKHVTYSSNSSFGMSHILKIFYGLTGEDLPLLGDEEKSRQKLHNGTSYRINRFIYSKKSASVFITQILKEQLSAAYHHQTFEIICGLLENALQSEKDSILKFSLVRLFSLHKDECCNLEISEYMNEFLALEVLFRRVFPVKQAVYIFFSAMKVIIKNMKACGKLTCSVTAMQMILKLSSNSKKIVNPRNQECFATTPRLFSLKKWSLDSKLDDTSFNISMENLIELMKTIRGSDNFFELEFVLRTFVRCCNFDRKQKMVQGQPNFFSDIQTKHWSILLTMMKSYFDFGLKVFTQRVIPEKLGNLNLSFLDFIINKKWQGSEKRKLFEGFKRTGAFSETVLLLESLSEERTSSNTMTSMVEAILGFIFSFEDMGAFLDENDFCKIGSKVITSKKYLLFFFRMKGLIGSVFEDRRHRARKLLLELNKKIVTSKEFENPQPGSILWRCRCLFNIPPEINQSVEESLNVIICNRGPEPFESLESLKIAQDLDDSQFDPLAMILTSNAHEFIKRLNEMRSTLNYWKSFVLNSRNKDKKVCIEPFRVVLKDSEGFFDNQTVFPFPHGQNVAVYGGSSISRILLNTAEGYNLIKKSSLISFVKGKVVFEFDRSSLITLMVEFAVKMNTEAGVDALGLIKNQRSLCIHRKRRQKTIRLQIKKACCTTILLIKLKF
jgi:hypothetical protein